jgi:hypothetical protein
MIWNRKTFEEIRRLRYHQGAAITKESFRVGSMEPLQLMERQAAQSFVQEARMNHGAKIALGDVETHSVLQPAPLDSTGAPIIDDINRYIIKARWSPGTSTALFQTGPFDGRTFTLDPQVLGQPIRAIERLDIMDLWEDELSSIAPVETREVLYYLTSWDDELGLWVYMPD